MSGRRGTLSGRPVCADGRHLLTMSDGESALVEPDASAEALAGRYGLDSVDLMPAIDFCAGSCVDGPLAGQITYAVNELGSRTSVWTGGRKGTYEVTTLAEDGRPATMRFLGWVDGTGT